MKTFSREKPTLTATEISKLTEIPLSTMHRLLSTLVNTGLLKRDGKEGNYSISHLMYTVGNLHTRSTDLLNSAQPVIELLNELTGEAVNLGILLDQKVVHLFRKEAKQLFRIMFPVGWSAPAYASAMGKALLSELKDWEIDNLFPEEELKKVTDKTISTKSELKMTLARIRSTGISFDSQGTFEGVEGIGSVVRDSTGNAVAAISIPVPIFRMNESNRERLVCLVKMACDLISYTLGYESGKAQIYNAEEIRTWWNQHLPTP